MSRLTFAALLGLLLACVMVEAGQPIAEPPGKVQAKPDWELLQGTWQIVGLASNGKAQPPRNFQGNTITFAKDKFTLREWGYPTLDFTFSIDPGKSPKTIDLTGKNLVVRGIYALDGDDLSLSFGIGGGRPTEFTTKPGGDSETFTLKRSRWERHLDREHGFSVEFPGKPEERLGAGTPVVTTLRFVSEMERMTYIVTVTPVRGKPTGKELLSVFDAAVRDAITEGNKSVTIAVESEVPFKAAGLSGREVTLDLGNPEGGEKAAARARVLSASERVYVLAVVGAEESVRSPSVGRFWSSFRLVSDKKN